jgi:hypothetical protein
MQPFLVIRHTAVNGLTHGVGSAAAAALVIGCW